jgi:hypothetical protein
MTTKSLSHPIFLISKMYDQMFNFIQFAKVADYMSVLISTSSRSVISDTVKLFAIVNNLDRTKYSKLCITNDFELFDYDRGIVCLQAYVTATPGIDDSNRVRIIITNIDDGMWAAESPCMGLTEAKSLLHLVAKEVLANLHLLPTNEKLNELLIPYKIYGVFE